MSSGRQTTRTGRTCTFGSASTRARSWPGSSGRPCLGTASSVTQSTLPAGWNRPVKVYTQCRGAFRGGYWAMPPFGQKIFFDIVKKLENLFGPPCVSTSDQRTFAPPHFWNPKHATDTNAVYRFSVTLYVTRGNTAGAMWLGVNTAGAMWLGVTGERYLIQNKLAYCLWTISINWYL